MNRKITQDKTDIPTPDATSDIHRTEPSYTVNSETQTLNSTETKQIDSKIIPQDNLFSSSQKKEELLEEKKELLKREKLLLEEEEKILEKEKFIIKEGKEILKEGEELFEEGEEYIKKLGPGLITGAADDDPSGIATYSQAGAQFGPSLLWLSVWTLPFMITIQEMCARIALVTGNGLASNIKHSYRKEIIQIITVLLLIANTFNIGANLGMMAKAVQLIRPGIPFTFLVIFIGLICLTLPVIVPYKKYARYLKWLVITLFSYIITGFMINMDWSVLLNYSIIPHITFSKDQILLITAILGTTISPYLFFWQTSQEIEEGVAEGKMTVHSRRGTNPAEIKKMKMDIWTGMFLSNIVMFFIIAVCANTLFVNGITTIDSASDAAMALLPLAGSFATVLFSIGIIGTGLLAVPVLAGSTSYAVSESFGWKEGLYRKFKSARAFYSIIIFSIIIGILTNFIGLHPIKALIYSAIVNGIIAPIIIISIVHISSSHKIMGHYKNSRIQKIIGWLAVILMSITAIAAIYSLF
jgi:NRAMP (natural resistance-associated macrophage protein)-like metal ion transporter